MTARTRTHTSNMQPARVTAAKRNAWLYIFLFKHNRDHTGRNRLKSPYTSPSRH